MPISLWRFPFFIYWSYSWEILWLRMDGIGPNIGWESGHNASWAGGRLRQRESGRNTGSLHPRNRHLTCIHITSGPVVGLYGAAMEEVGNRSGFGRSWSFIQDIGSRPKVGFECANAPESDLGIGKSGPATIRSLNAGQGPPKCCLQPTQHYIRQQGGPIQLGLWATVCSK